MCLLQRLGAVVYLFAALLRCSDCVVIDSMGLSSVAVGGDEDWAGSEADVSTGIPKNLAYLQAVYYERYQREFVDRPVYRSENRGKVKVLLGIFTTLGWREKDARKVLKDTWLRHPDVCLWDNITDTCTIRVVFVACKYNQKQAGPPTIMRNGLQVLADEPYVHLMKDIDEHMNRGKTFAWFQRASRAFQWADYVFKCDLDAWPHVGAILDALPLYSECEAFLGKPWTCNRDDAFCPARDCGPPEGHNFTSFPNYDMAIPDATPRQNCWTYMQGGLYGLSRTLAFRATEWGEWWSHHKAGVEDAVTGKAINDYARRTGTCVHIWNSTQVINDRMFVHFGHPNQHPGAISSEWNSFYGIDGKVAAKRRKGLPPGPPPARILREKRATR